MQAEISVEIVVALPDRQKLVTLSVAEGTTAGDAVLRSGLADEFPEVDFRTCPIAVWGQVVDRDRRLVDSDRVELLRPLGMDPREARRQLAEAGRTMARRR